MHALCFILFNLLNYANGKYRWDLLRVRPWYILFIYTKVWVFVWPTGVGGLAEEPYLEEELYEDQIADLSVEQVEGSLQ